MPFCEVVLPFEGSAPLFILAFRRYGLSYAFPSLLSPKANVNVHRTRYFIQNTPTTCSHLLKSKSDRYQPDRI